MQTDILKKILKKEGFYALNVHGMCVEMSYAKNNKSFYDCILEIIKQKSRG